MSAKKSATAKVFIDTNVILRFFLQDNEHMFAECEDFFTRIDRGELKSCTSSVVLLELVYVLTRTYRYSREEAVQLLKRVLSLRNISLIERTDTRRALEIWKQHGIKYGDCLIASQVPKNATLVTYDLDFAKLEGLNVTTPAQLVT